MIFKIVLISMAFQAWKSQLINFAGYYRFPLTEKICERMKEQEFVETQMFISLKYQYELM